MESDVSKRQHPGRRFIDTKFQRSWEEKEGEGVPMLEKRQHPGKRAVDHPCGFRGTCGQTGLFQLLGDLSRDPGEAKSRAGSLGQGVSGGLSPVCPTPSLLPFLP
ncbi:thyrotropin releasing hormone [Sigmodon hispidus]